MFSESKSEAMAEYYCATEIYKPTRVLAPSSLEILSRSTSLRQWYLSGFFSFFLVAKVFFKVAKICVCFVFVVAKFLKDFFFLKKIAKFFYWVLPC
jgi:hypothetical protein